MVTRDQERSRSPSEGHLPDLRAYLEAGVHLAPYPQQAGRRDERQSEPRSEVSRLRSVCSQRPPSGKSEYRRGERMEAKPWSF